jgi:hypothetical protein
MVGVSGVGLTGFSGEIREPPPEICGRSKRILGNGNLRSSLRTSVPCDCAAPPATFSGYVLFAGPRRKSRIDPSMKQHERKGNEDGELKDPAAKSCQKAQYKIAS